MLTVGVDMIEIARIERGIKRHGDRFLQRFFTEQEQAYCNGKSEAAAGLPAAALGRAASLAGRFAVKEAVGKALGTGIGDIRWLDVEVVCDERGKPELVLHNAAKELASARGLTQWAISLSHTETHAIGFVAAMGGD